MTITPRTAYVRKVARQLLRDAGVRVPPVDLRLICSACGLKYEEVDYFPDDVDALIIANDDADTVAVVNRNQSTKRRRFSLAHELGHHLLHRDPSVLEDTPTIDSPPSDSDDTNGTVHEREANVFAGELLVPVDFLKKAFRPGMTALDVAQIFDVSESVAAIAISAHFRALFKM